MVRDLEIVGEQPVNGNGSRRAADCLAACGVTKTYGGRRVVDDVSLSVSHGEIVGLLGANGAGKTTTFYMMVGLEATETGEIREKAHEEGARAARAAEPPRALSVSKGPGAEMARKRAFRPRRAASADGPAGARRRSGSRPRSARPARRPHPGSRSPPPGPATHPSPRTGRAPRRSRRGT